MNESLKNENGFVGYEYKEMTIKRSLESIYVDCYRSFGWELDGVHTPPQGATYALLKFKRNRKLHNKSEITRLQRQFDAAITEIQSLELSKVMKASTIAYIVGLLGTAFMTGSVFAVTGGSIALSVILAIPAFVGWIAPYLLFRKISNRKSEELGPVIDNKFDEIYQVCEKASRLLSI